jgi:hypothetical protein
MSLLHIPSKNYTTKKCYLFLKGLLHLVSSLCYNTEWYYDQIWWAAGNTAAMYRDIRQKSKFSLCTELAAKHSPSSEMLENSSIILSNSDQINQQMIIN